MIVSEEKKEVIRGETTIPPPEKAGAITEEKAGAIGVTAKPLPPSFPETLANTEVYEPETNWLCCSRYKDRSKFMTILQNLPLSPVQKQIIEVRYLHILRNLQQRTRNHAIVFYLGHFIITVGSLFVPALLSIQNSDQAYSLTGSAFNVHVYWAAFALSLLVTIWNGILTLFKIDKKYYFLNTILERLRSEGWQYVSLTGRYSGHLIGKRKPTHENQFVYFTHYIEKIKMKQIEEEYYKTDEKSQAPSHGTSTNTTASTASSTMGNSMIDWYAPSLDKPLPSMVQQVVPEPVRSAIDSLSMPSLPATYDVYPPYYSSASSSAYAPRFTSQYPSVTRSASTYTSSTPFSVPPAPPALAPLAPAPLAPALSASVPPASVPLAPLAPAPPAAPASFSVAGTRYSPLYRTYPVKGQPAELEPENTVPSAPSSTASSKVTTPIFSATHAPATPPSSALTFSFASTTSPRPGPVLLSSPSLRALEQAMKDQENREAPPSASFAPMISDDISPHPTE